MKRILFIVLILFVVLVGCNQNGSLEVEDTYLLMRVGDERNIHVINEVPTAYISKSNIISVDNEGKITALETGNAIVTVSAKNYKSIDISIEIIAIDNQELRVYFVDVGQADCIIAVLPNDEVLMIDAGLDHYSVTASGNYPSWENIVSVLEKENISTIDHLLITHNHADHYYFIPDVIENYEVKNVYGSGSTRNNFQFMTIMQAIADAGLVLQIVQTYDKIIDEPHLTLQVVASRRVLYEEDYEVNYNSVMAKLTFRNRAFMFTGDAGSAEGDGEPRAMESDIDLRSDVLKVGHHGSYASSSVRFLMAVSPKYAVITTANQTTTGHPHDTAVRRLNLVQAVIYESRTHGTILFKTNGFDLDIETQKGEN